MFQKTRPRWVRNSLFALGGLLLLGGMGCLYLESSKRSSVKDVPHPADSLQILPKVYKYNLPDEGYHIEYGEVKSGENLSLILSHYGLSVEEVHALNLKTEGVFDVRKIRNGQKYAVYTKQPAIPADTLQKQTAASVQSLPAPRPDYFVYEEDARNYVVFDLNPPYRITRGEKPSEWKTKEVKGVIASSLWVAMEDADTSPQLAVVLSHIFGWTIDFFGLQKDDEFRVIYEQEYVEGEPLQDFHVLAASFRASDSLYYAIPFVQDGEELYYNEKGNSLEGAFLKAPLDFYRISSRFTNARFHPVLKRYRAHHGVDYAAPTGTPVYAIGSGKVIAKGYQAGGGGNFVKIKHNGAYVTSYMHLSRFAKGLQVGSVVKQKEVIGYVGSTGLSTGPHLDFRVYENGKPVNPLTVKSQPKKPISEQNMSRYAVVRDSLIQRLDRMEDLCITKADSVKAEITNPDMANPDFQQK